MGFPDGHRYESQHRSFSTHAAVLSEVRGIVCMLGLRTVAWSAVLVVVYGSESAVVRPR